MEFVMYILLNASKISGIFPASGMKSDTDQPLPNHKVSQTQASKLQGLVSINIFV